jgi:hypothetical protein
MATVIDELRYAHHEGCICAACQPDAALSLAEKVREIASDVHIGKEPREDAVEILEAAARSIVKFAWRQQQDAGQMH